MQENNFKVNPHSLKTAVSGVEKNKIITRGYNQKDLIEKIRYSVLHQVHQLILLLQELYYLLEINMQELFKKQWNFISLKFLLFI